MSEPRRPPVAGLAEAAEILGVRPANVRKMLERRNGIAATELKAGPVWYRVDIVRVKRQWDRQQAKEAARRAKVGIGH